ncbi:TatD family hydrolase [Corynebacterium felinum]|uniref:TatD DNase family protein n=1 Tax=Corynebacterium felinum TaxID=131318 RepID=A0ABU2B911_9CORY|nr:TatD family hydrolase [Corynebacterium felinum]MDF5821554.1 TatD family hydrolase [Corynebacterium felinum]MDR7355088.1 TatD DNase family protein [Corynebacterium felinum]WJY94439.1 putative deoxyribonuclease YcfH [Corynebacterium felinum]
MSKKKPRPTPVPAAFIPNLTDAHTHLASCGARTAEEVAALMDRARTAGVRRVCTVGDGLAEAQLALEAATGHQDVFAACAIHPTRAHELDEDARAHLRAMACDPNCVAIGETGLDTYWIKHDPHNTAALDVQEEALRWHIDLACESGKALMIHNREADEDLLRVLGDAPRPVETILHCFSSPWAVADVALERGYVLSFAGNVTFKRNDELRAIAKAAPIEQIVIETDAPYMTPEPYRGARNESALIGHTAQVIADVRGVKVEDFAECVSRNFDRIYGLA